MATAAKHTGTEILDIKCRNGNTTRVQASQQSHSVTTTSKASSRRLHHTPSGPKSASGRTCRYRARHNIWFNRIPFLYLIGPAADVRVFGLPGGESGEGVMSANAPVWNDATKYTGQRDKQHFDSWTQKRSYNRACRKALAQGYTNYKGRTYSSTQLNFSREIVNSKLEILKRTDIQGNRTNHVCIQVGDLCQRVRSALHDKHQGAKQQQGVGGLVICADLAQAFVQHAMSEADFTNAEIAVFMLWHTRHVVLSTTKHMSRPSARLKD